jgi:hypothetical protein
MCELHEPQGQVYYWRPHHSPRVGDGELRDCICPSGHEGDRGEVWLARVLPQPASSVRDAIVDDAVRDREPGPAGWQTYLDRTLPKIASDPSWLTSRW